MFDEAQKETLRAEINRILDESVGALMDAGHLESGSVIVLGCSTSEITGARIGKGKKDNNKGKDKKDKKGNKNGQKVRENPMERRRREMEEEAALMAELAALEAG